MKLRSVRWCGCSRVNRVVGRCKVYQLSEFGFQVLLVPEIADVNESSLCIMRWRRAAHIRNHDNSADVILVHTVNGVT